MTNVIDKNLLATEVMTITSAMLKRAKAGQWDGLGKMELERKAFLEAYFAEAIDDDHAEQALSLIESVMAADRKLVALVVEQKRFAVERHVELKTGQAESVGYLGHQG